VALAVTDELVVKTDQAFTVYTFRNEMLSGISGGPQIFIGSAQAVRESGSRSRPFRQRY